MAIHPQQQMALSITRSAESSIDYVQILGEVDLADTTQLGLAAGQLIDANAGIVYVDLGGTTFIGSTLVAFLIHVANNATVDRTLVLCRPSPMARRVIELVRLDELFSLRPDLPAGWPAEADELDLGHMWDRYKSA
jgi:anti-anti-sigma factor